MAQPVGPAFSRHLGGQPQRDLGGGGGIVLYSSATLNNLKVNTSTQISTNSKAGTFLSISRDFEIAKGQRFNANGYQVIAAIPSGDNQGEFVP